MLAELVHSHILVVEIEVDRIEHRGPGEAAYARELECDGVAQEGLVVVIGKQYPVLVALHSEHL